MLRIDNGVACVAGCFARGGEVFGGFGRHGEDGAASAFDGWAKGLEVFEVCDAEGAPVATIVCREGVFSAVMRCDVLQEVRKRRG